ncbi:NlpC/P60 family protein [Anaerococcus sp. ENR1011]|uniref:NlpC/P60 family protein n=1 Tax=Anaerococcus groningensis TaxID=3115616 RepID=A0ABW9N0U2_9FIRM
MNKKKIGAAFSLVAAVTAGATAYASTINNLESDRNTNAMFTPNYSDNTYDYNLVKSDYTNDLKNTAIANETRVVQNTAEKEEAVAKVEENAKEILKTSVINVVAKESVEEESQDVRADEETESEETTEVADEELNTSDDEVILYDDSNLPEVDEENTELASTEKTEEEQTSEEVVDDQGDEVLAYDDTKLDEALSDQNEEDLEVAEADDEVVNYLDNNAEEVETEEKEESNQVVSKFVNVEALYIRSSKSMDDNTNAIRTLAAGDKVEGVIEGDWLKIEEGYLNLKYLSNEYPQNLVDTIQARKAAEAKKEEEAKIAQQVQAKKEEEAKAAQQEQIKKEEEAKATQQKEVKEEKQETPAKYGTPFSGWVHNTAVINVRDKAKTGNIIGTLAKGAIVEGEIADGWVRINYNGKTAFVSSYYLTTQAAQEAEKQALENAKAQQQAQQAPVVEENKETSAEAQKAQQTVVEEVVDEEEIVAEQTAAPVVNQNGQQAANIASRFAGSPYVWGASDPSVGFDCSGLVTYAYRQLGVSLPHSSQAQFNNGYAVGINNLQPGDLVFFSNHSSIDHVGIVTSSDGTFIHASTPKSGVKYDNVYSNYYQKVFAGARRIF